MKDIHVECLPDELLVSKIGFTKKKITHHQGKSRVFHYLSKNENKLAIVDEDPGSPQTNYEKGLRFLEEVGGAKFYTDNSNNKVIILKTKLEDWIINLCNSNKIDITKFGLPKKPNELHDTINHRLNNFGNLIDSLLDKNNSVLMKLKDFLK